MTIRPGMHEIQGFAWSGNGKIRAVDVTVDGGATWQEARLDEPVLDKCLTRFRFPWNWAGGPATIASRAVRQHRLRAADGAGHRQGARDRRLRAAPQRRFPVVRSARAGGQECDRASLVLALGAAIVAAGLRNAADRNGRRRRRILASKFGKPISNADIAAWDIDIRTTDGKGLPVGRGTVAEGKVVYDAKCVACHGADAKGGPVYRTMVGGIGSFKTNTRVLTPGSMYPYAPILFDYIRRAMPMDHPQSLSTNETYAVSAYLLNLNGIIPDNAVMDQNTLARGADAESQRIHRRRPARHEGRCAA